MGDSFTWGVGAEMHETYPARLERLLDRGGHPGAVEVINVGVPRYFPEIERMLLEHYGLRYEPDLVLIAFVPNDVRDTALGIDALRASPEGYLISRRSQRLGRAGTWLYIHSHTARTILSGYLARSEVSRRTARERQVAAAEYRAAWRQIGREYARMSQAAWAHGAELVAVYIPLANLSPAEGMRFGELVKEHVAAFIDTRPALAAARKRSGRFLYWPEDGHCDRHGYEVIARTLASELKRRGLVP